MSIRMSRTRAARRWTGIVLGVAVAVSLAACSGGNSGGTSTTNTNAKAGGELNVGFFAEPDSLDPATMRQIPSYQAVTSIYDQLLWTFNGKSSSFVPGLAASYSVSSDGKTYTFKLKSGVKFQDGTPFNAQAVKDEFDRIENPATQSVAAKAALGTYTSSTVVDNLTLKVNFSSPNGSFLNNVASPLLAIPSPTAVKKYGADFSHHPVGTGPFEFSSWAPGQSITLKRNPDYKWGPAVDGLSKGPAKLDGITFRIVTNSSSQANALQTNSLQMGEGLAIPDVTRLTSSGFTKNLVVASGMPFGFMLNVTKAPTDDLAVRQAIQYAIDTKAVNKTVFSNVYSPANTVLTAATFAHDTTPGYAYDPAKAAKLLDAAGWKAGANGIREKDGQPLSLQWLISNGYGFQDAAVLITAQLKKVGIQSTITQEVPPTISQDIDKGVMNVAGIFDYATDPYILNSLFSCAEVGVGPNYGHFCDHEIDSQIATANATVDASARAKLYQKVQQELMKQALFVPIYDNAVVWVLKPSVKGVQYTTMGIPVLTGTTL